MVERPTDANPAGSRLPPKDDNEARLQQRLERLGESLEAHRAAEEAANRRGKSSGFAQATKVASEFVAGVIVGAGIGWGIDKAAGTTPWALIVFLLLGFAAGVLNVLRAEGKVAEAGARLREPSGQETQRPNRDGDRSAP
ncbi:AtpZ/AtpI family protein [Pinisolibacter sp.]|uniref:AtpZ/AtpI family protein n=1 Tax=Pinisolibacter sp. TaxID=2172024 RepID=UPI002FDD7068